MPFPYEKYATEDQGTPDFVMYHHKQLQLLGVKLGQGGFKVMDLHNEKTYKLQHGNVLYKGGVDAGVVPFGTGQASALQLLRTLFEHKQSAAAKQAYRDSHPELVGKVMSCAHLNHCLLHLVTAEWQTSSSGMLVYSRQKATEILLTLKGCWLTKFAVLECLPASCLDRTHSCCLVPFSQVTGP